MRAFNNCLKHGKIKKFKATKEKTKVELRAAKEDLKEAKDRASKKKYKYATITAYYSFFHSARVLLYLKGFRERSHYCLKVAVEALYVKEKVLQSKFVEYFEEAMGLREAADYQSVFSRNGALRAIKGAEEFLKKTGEIVNA